MFETLTLPRPSKSRIAGPVALLIHAAAAAGILLITAWRVGDAGDPGIPIVFRVPSGPPSGEPASKGGSTFRERKAGIPVPPSVAVQPVSVGPTAGMSPEASSDSGTNPQSPSAGSSPVGGPGAPGTGPSTEGDPDSPVPANAPNVVAPRLLLQPQPEYPELSRRIRERGVVALQAVIGLDGSVEDVSILRGASALLDAAAIRAVREWRYVPATLNGRAVRVFLTATVQFTLR